MAINLANPVNWQHPLNRGLVAWYIALPGQGRSTQWLDIAGGVNATLTNGPTWQGRASGWGALSCDGTDDYATIPAGSIFGKKLTGAVVTFACWFNPTGSLTAYQALFDCGSTSLRSLGIFLGPSASTLYIAIGNSAGNNHFLTNPIANNTWQHFVVTCDGSSITSYLNGVSNGTGGTVTGSFDASYEARIGGNPSGGGAAYQGYIDDVSIYNRVLSANDVYRLYAQSITGYQGMINRLKGRFISSVPAAPSFKSAWARGSNVILQPGVLA